MNTTHQYKVLVCSNKQGHVLIDEKAIENGHTSDKCIYDPNGFDTVWNDALGNVLTSGFRLTKDRKSKVLITIVNSYEKDIKNQLLESLIINN